MSDQKNRFCQAGTQKHFDVLVFGSGISGLYFTLELLKRRPHTNIALITKTTLGESNSRYAQGGIAATLGDPSALRVHIEDTTLAGGNVGDPYIIETITAHAQNIISGLKNYGVDFDVSEQGNVDLVQEGGHSQRCILHHGDTTGREIIRALVDAIKLFPNIQIFEYHTAVNLIRFNKKRHAPVIGCYVLEEQTGLIHTFLATTTVLATGGAGKTYRYTTNCAEATGDGIAMAYRTGAHVQDMEFYQFHPTLLYHSTVNNFLISEAVRGEGAYLRRVEDGERFMRFYAPESMELSTRDIVSRAIFSEIEKSHHGFVYLDIRHKSRDFLQKHFPMIFAQLEAVGIDMSKDMIPVVPAAHYLCGGIHTDIDGKTTLPRLYAIGETACTGFHGANRLASNSLLEAASMAEFAAQACIKELTQSALFPPIIPIWNSSSVLDARRATQISAHWHGLRSEMTSYAGIIRTEPGLKDLLKLIQLRRKIIEEYYWNHIITRDLIELRNIVLVAELITRAALKRKQSVGTHFREDTFMLRTPS